MQLTPPYRPLRLALAGAFLTAALIGAGAWAHDYGVQGKVWEIIEVDMREIVMRDAAKQDWAKKNSELADSANTFFDRLPAHPATGVTRSTTRWIDPSFVLDKDVYGPLKNADGEYEWKVLFKAGTRANPLSVQRPYNVMLFFDIHSDAQVAFVIEAARRHPGKVLPVELSGGNPTKLAGKLDTPIYSANDSMVSRFQITESPSLLYPGSGEHALELGLTTFAPPYSQDTLDNTWPEGLKPGTVAHK